ncbi:MAG TPA: response regulator transcription factor [Desulfobacteraceae bacterium]|nr:response regulator transcription factor [Desulfobacteraceae bacterium]
MRLLLGSANRVVLKRWANLLEGGHRVERAESPGALKKMSALDGYDLILVHRPMVDREMVAQVVMSPENKVFLLSDRPDEDEGLDFLKRGIVGYGNTYMSQPRLLEAIKSISNGSVWVGQRIMQRLIAEVHARVKEDESRQKKKPGLDSLTLREKQISGLVAKGRSNLEIASALKITERTVKAHLTSIYEKTGTGSRLSLALLVNRG